LISSPGRAMRSQNMRGIAGSSPAGGAARTFIATSRSPPGQSNPFHRTKALPNPRVSGEERTISFPFA
jgi:hypothetical protein